MFFANLKANPNSTSPVFIWNNSATISATTTLRQSWENYKPSSMFYLPFNYTRVTNNSLAEIIFYPNQDTEQGIVIPAGSNVSIDGDIVPALSSFAIKNNDSTQDITASQITVLSSRVQRA